MRRLFINKVAPRDGLQVDKRFVPPGDGGPHQGRHRLDDAGARRDRHREPGVRPSS